MTAPVWTEIADDAALTALLGVPGERVLTKDRTALSEAPDVPVEALDAHYGPAYEEKLYG